jgi:tRNA dimethylallyltransferase
VNTLLVLLGPTAVGKTEFSLSVAEHYGCPVISADSRQFYAGLSIGTAVPTLADFARVPHYFVGFLPIDTTYSAGLFETDVLRILATRNTDPLAVLCGGSMLYIDAVCSGIDEIPPPAPAVRSSLYERYTHKGIPPLLDELRELDPIYYNTVDHHNYKRILHALEICLTTGRPFSSFHTHRPKSRPFHIRKFGLTLPREVLYERINCRVDRMMDDGLLDEARQFYPFRHFNSLNTVGYKELFLYFDGLLSLSQAIDRIKSNTRRYARQQLTWFRRDPTITWLSPTDTFSCVPFRLSESNF